MQIGAFIACVGVIADQVSSIPLRIYERQPNGGEVVAYDHPLFHLLGTQPNPEVSASDFRQAGQVHCLINGNAYIEVIEDRGGRPAALYLRSPFRTFPYREQGGALIYKTSDTPSGAERIIKQDACIHIKGMGFDGVVGLSPIKFYMREVLGADMAAQNYSSTFWANDSRPGGYLEAPGIMKPEQKLAAANSWISGHSRGNTNRMAVLDGGLTWKKVGVDPEESQFLETRKFNQLQIAGMFRVPPHLIGASTGESKESLEQRNLEFLIYTIKPWLKKWEHAINARLFAPSDKGKPNKYFVKFDTTELERPTFDVLLKGIQTARYSGGINQNEIRKLLKMNPLKKEDFDTDNPAERYWMPVNMIDVSQNQPLPRGEEVVPESPSGNPTGNSPAPGAGNQQPDKGGIGGAHPTQEVQPPTNGIPKSRAFAPIFNDAFGRCLARKNVTEKDFSRIFSPVLLCIATAGRTEDIIPAELASFTQSYLAGMFHRLASWTEASREEELERAVKEISKRSNEIPSEVLKEKQHEQ